MSACCERGNFDLLRRAGAPWSITPCHRTLLKLLTVLFLVLLNGFFVASEFAIVKVRGAQLDALEARGSKRVKLARCR